MINKLELNTIIPERLERLMGEDFHLRSGNGAGINGEVDACIMQAVGWLAGGDGKTDGPKCASPAIRAFCIRINDSDLFQNHRDLLKPFAARIVGTRDDNDVQRGFICADYAVRIFAPFGLRQEPKHRFDEYAEKMEQCAEIVDRETALAGREIADAAAAAYAAYATARRTDAAYAAAAAAAYAAYAAYAYAAAADAAAAAAAAAAAGKTTDGDDYLRAKALECLQALIDVK